MAVPKRKISPSRAGMRRSGKKMALSSLTEDRDSGELRRRHHIDFKSGKYRNRQILDPSD